MSGLCGFIGTRKNKADILQTMQKEIHHRGPSASEVYNSDKASLGFCWLDIGVSEGKVPPIEYKDGKKVILLDGELFNTNELRTELEKEGCQFSTKTEQEILAYGLEKDKKDFLNKLNGVFTIGFWDEEKQSFFASRDFFGVKPFYYAMIDGCFVFASEIKAILQFPGFEKQVNEEALEQFLSFQYPILEESFFKGIYKLQPGHCMTYVDGKIEIEKYFEPLLTPKVDKNEAETIQSLRKVLKEAVQRHMTDGLEVGSLLSGGVDSSFLAAEFTGKKTFTVGFLNEDNHYSEVHQASDFAKDLNLEHYAKIIEKEEFLASIPDIMYHMDEPVGDPATVALYFGARDAVKHVKCIISGEGPDEMFAGYNIYGEPDSLKYITWLPKGLRRGLAGVAKKLPNIKGKNYIIRGGRSVEERFIGNAQIFSNQERRDLLLRRTGALTTEEFLRPQYEQVKNLSDVDKMQQIDINNWLPGDIFNQADRMVNAHSLGLRVPYVDNEVWEIAKRLPARDKVRNGQTKYIFRKAIEESLTLRKSQVKKLGFPVPIRVWMKDEDWYTQMKDLFSGEIAAKFFHTDKLVKLIDDHYNEGKDNSRKIWTVYVFLVWHKVYFADEDK